MSASEHADESTGDGVKWRLVRPDEYSSAGADTPVRERLVRPDEYGGEGAGGGGAGGGGADGDVKYRLVRPDEYGGEGVGTGGAGGETKERLVKPGEYAAGGAEPGMHRRLVKPDEYAAGGAEPGTHRRLVKPDEYAAGGGAGAPAAAQASDSGYTFEQFKIDLQGLQDAIGTISSINGEITDYMSGVRQIMDGLGDSWNSPAHDTFPPLKTWFDSTQNALGDLLEEIIRRLQASYDNYHAAELANFGNVTPGESA